ncbi:(2Fe-2S)-binding protein [Thalassotalea agarivorans]|uniref:Isoquinoline 1-oxidoreductase, alpha subunit n=1 Tax=Thalassotalea agarivorans TaxID=349064 RepID=A0A1H9ZGQ4_THASX|nr:(2Fe-2S)-binding protein [Thalassotalea agarivorans]SES80685.1 isoquinoline 1-oxidoreductase, alpha subunit [Thalassotalea agarivorans]
MTILKINGKTHKFNQDPSMPLLWVLRDILKFKGTKYGCGKGLCGACTVHINGQPTRSCVLPVSAVEGQEITTIEGLSENIDHPVQQAWQELNVPQCGYCQSGQMMAAAALLESNKAPSEQEIEMAMSGNICRCGTYPRIKEAINRAAELATEVK